jgi:putative colanic acid biosynthesis UDP-glucose lipid carrier transferase
MFGGKVFEGAMVDLGRETTLGDFKLDQTAASLIQAPVNGSRIKRTADIVIAALLLLFVLPLFLIVALGVILDSPGPVFFVQRRTGLGGRPIEVFKFRTMRVMEDGEAVKQASRNDNRVTRVGRFLRRSSIDELPQLANVLRGDMSLVGPRPHALAHDQYYGALVPNYAQRFRARPGITGLAQVNGLRGEIHSLEGMVDRVSQDNAYIDDWSLGLDLKILMKTAVVAAFQSTAY